MTRPIEQEIIIDPKKLRIKSVPVTKFDERLYKLLDDMREKLLETGALGLAAVQVGEYCRACLVSVNDVVTEFVNPKIIKQSNFKNGLEECLSLPLSLPINVKRPHNITVNAFNRKGEPFTKELKGWNARCICHEIDHMEGVLITDKSLIRSTVRKLAQAEILI